MFAALNTATGEVLTDCKPRHRNQVWLSFLKLIDRHVPKDLDVHLIIDNYATHKHGNVATWLEDPKHKDRWHVHYTPTSTSWLNLVERWFRELTDKQLRRGSFTSRCPADRRYGLWADHWNDNPQPFIWHKTAEEIIAKVRRARAALATPTKSATDQVAVASEPSPNTRRSRSSAPAR